MPQRGCSPRPTHTRGLLGGSKHGEGTSAGAAAGVIFKNKQDCSQQSRQARGGTLRQLLEKEGLFGGQ